MKRSNYLLRTACVGIWVGMLASCDYLSLRNETVEPGEDVPVKVARVNDEFLYQTDLADIVPVDAAPDDSARLVKRYIDNWIRKQLLIKEAASNIEFDQQELDRKILDYRYALMVYEYEKYYVNSTLNREVSEEEIKEYYEANKDNFELKQNIIRGIFIKVPKEAPRLNKLRDYLKLDEEKDRELLKSYCYRFATDFMLDEAAWVNFEELVVNTPLMSIPNKVQWLKENNYVETSGDHYLYFLKISDHKISNELSPLEFVSDQIKTIIINKRKTELAARLEKEIYEKAQKSDVFEIYTE
ncbi:peptidylprolyl isomerase [Nafulsella turpanensis]|uniref:peptidyl-prolyl cis-trans isomerase n=1 Tax=Nafulsella turpanensis TaxID=1265690 RepID=UPI001F3A7470|nr:peptidyl-prolyl cis-trans isomerase [Nafulsella turpanensis]